MFARWWSEEVINSEHRLENCYGDGNDSDTTGSTSATSRIMMSINARRIMNNDLFGLTADTVEVPYLIWWPLKPTEDTLSALLRQCPQIKEQVIAAYICCDYQRSYDSHKEELPPSYNLLLAASNSPNTHYRDDVKKEPKIWVSNWSELINFVQIGIPGASSIGCDMIEPEVAQDFDFLKSTYWGEYPQVNVIERHVWATEMVLKLVEQWAGKMNSEIVHPAMVEKFEQSQLSMQATALP